MQKPLIFTDLDGTLLDEASYSFDAALPALRRIQAYKIPLVFCSSKTRAEIEFCRLKMHNTHPFVSENGGGIFMPHDYFSIPVEGELINGYRCIALGKNYAEIRRHFVTLRKQTRAKVIGFSDMSVAEVASLTGLSTEEAVLAKQREFDEPFIFEGLPEDDFLRAIEAAGLNWTQGKIFHIMGRHDKGFAVNILLALYAQEYGAVESIGLGDSLNDLPLLQTVDHAVLVKHEDRSFDTRIKIAGLIKTHRPGPSGWNETVLQFLSNTNLRE